MPLARFCSRLPSSPSAPPPAASRIQQLSLSFQPTRAELRRLCKLLARNWSLERLELAHKGLADEDALRLAKMIGTSDNLTSLSLLGNAFSKRAAVELVRAAEARAAASANADGGRLGASARTGFGNGGLRTLCGLTESTVFLGLAGRNLSDADLVLLEWELRETQRAPALLHADLCARAGADQPYQPELAVPPIHGSSPRWQSALRHQLGAPPLHPFPPTR